MVLAAMWSVVSRSVVDMVLAGVAGVALFWLQIIVKYIFCNCDALCKTF
jgi:hypothetical protein